MKLLEIRLENFRPFAGEQRFEFATRDDRNVTLFFGANGSGKTTLLNAFTWALYGEMSGDVEHQEQLVNNAVWQATPFGASVTVAVDLVFEHHESTYRVRREIVATKSSDEQKLPPAKLRVWEQHDDGATTDVSNIGQQRIDSILPQRLSRFCFFNGERIEHLVSKSAYSEVKTAIKTLLGIEQVERALEHLPKVKRRLVRELNKHGGDKAGDIMGQIEDARDQRSERSARIEQLEAENAQFGDEQAAVLELLQQHHAAGPLQEQRNAAERDLRDARSGLQALRQRRRKSIAEQGFTAFTASLATRTTELAASLQERGELPAPLKREFVEGLLEQGSCICGTPLTPGGEPHRHVTDWRARAGLAEVESAWERLRGDVSYLQDARNNLRSQFEESAKEIVEGERRVRKLEEDKTRLDAEVAKLPTEDVQRLEAKRRELDDRIRRNERTIGMLRGEVNELSNRIKSLHEDFKRAEITGQLAGVARRRVQTTEEVHDALERILTIRTETVRNELDERIKRVFREITVKPFMPELTADFELGLFQEGAEDRDHPVPKSTGENQILSLVFVAAVSALASERRERRRSGASVLDEGETFPIVMDAAFGSLDENYQRDISRALPTMAPQMIVLVSKSQGSGTVMTELEPYIDRLGVIVSYTSKSGSKSEDIELRGRSHPYIHTGAERDQTVLQEVQ